MLTEIPGVRVGHWTDPVAATGCTVVLLPEGTVASGEVRGGAPATREFALLDPARLVRRLDAVVLTGGSAFGLAAADGVMRFCEEHGMGVPTPAGVVPIVVAFGLFDLAVGDASVRPGADQGYAACAAATSGRYELGRVGAGTGATVGVTPIGPTGDASAGPGPSAAHGPHDAPPGGTGDASAGSDGTDDPVAAAPGRRPGGLVTATVAAGELRVAALVAVNAFGVPGGDDGAAPAVAAGFQERPGPFGNTTIGVVATNAALDKLGCYVMAQGAHDGLARALFPPHARSDGDAFVAAAVGGVPADIDAVRALTVHAAAHAIRSLA